MESAQRDVREIQNQMVSIKKLHSSQDKTIKKDFSKFKKSEPTKKFDKSRKCYRCDSTQHLAHEYWSSIKGVRVENCNSRTNKLNILLQRNEKIFSPGIGKLEKFCCRLQMKPNYKPVFFKPRTVSFALKERIESELNRLVAEDIEPVTYSDWATPIVPVIKQNGNLRICGDYKVTINPRLKIEQYPLPRIEDIFA
ncbi:transposon Tf2-9 polyprotein [Trichonephila clavipes]|nr:transposon Tf2-9 polyprotein [Trichonephila clavipes]